MMLLIMFGIHVTIMRFTLIMMVIMTTTTMIIILLLTILLIQTHLPLPIPIPLHTPPTLSPNPHSILYLPINFSDLCPIPDYSDQFPLTYTHYQLIFSSSICSLVTFLPAGWFFVCKMYVFRLVFACSISPHS